MTCIVLSFWNKIITSFTIMDLDNNYLSLARQTPYQMEFCDNVIDIVPQLHLIWRPKHLHVD